MFHMLRPHEPVLLQKLKQNGYVWWGGKNDLIPAQYRYEPYCDVKFEPDRTKLRPKPHDWNEWRGDPTGDNWYSFYVGKLDKGNEDVYFNHDWAMVYGVIEQIRNAPEDKPLCIYLPLRDPHPPYAVEEPWYSMIDRDKVPPRIPTQDNWDGKPRLNKGIWEKQQLQEWTEERWQELRATYYGTCARMDYQFKLVLDALREAGIYDDSAVFVFSDHGDWTGDFGLVEKDPQFV